MSTKLKETKPQPQEVEAESVPNFEYNNRTFESYKKWGLEPEQYKVLQDQEAKFLLEVAPDRVKDIRRVITKMLRTRQPTMEEGKRVIRDFLIIYENWYGEMWDGNPATTVSDHIEGWY